ncbi:MAG: Cytidylate kinase [candidate division TM6 bacterium GW2011_GWF2_37_49]|nr:MAG: Cytidylate kinase [candidate division TM6 bacterium GW2011_GWF2_37_49]
MIITIDGPAASGKSSIATEICKRLKMVPLKTGLLYRAVAYILVQELDKTINIETPNELSINDLNFIKDITYEFTDGIAHVLFKGKDVTEKLSFSSIDQIASIVSANKNVRELLLDVQRQIATKYNIVADGRDCGSVVFPSADYKFYLTATAEARAKRVMADVARKAETRTLEDVQKDIELRDKRDKERDVAPLIVPSDAITIDNTNLDFEQTVQEFLKHIKI